MEGEKKRKRKRYLYRVKGLNYFIYTRLIGGSRLPRLPSDRLKRWQGKMVHRRKSCVTPGGGGWRRFNEGSFSPAYIAPPLRSNFFFFPPPPFALCNARYRPSLLHPPLATLILSTAEAITYAKRREREEEEVTSLPRLERDWVLETISALFRPRFLLVVLEKKRRGTGEDVYGAPGT